MTVEPSEISAFTPLISTVSSPRRTVSGFASSTVAENVFSENDIGVQIGIVSGGISFPANDTTIANNDVSNSDEEGILVRGSASATIANTTVAAAGGVATVAAGLAVVLSRRGGRLTSVLLAYPAAMTALFLPPVVAALYSPALAGVLTLTGFAVIGWVGYDVVFVAGAAVVAFAALRRGL